VGYIPGMNEPWTKGERAILRRLDSPAKIQDWLNETPYSTDPIYRCPRRVMADRLAHCVDGGLFAAAALRRLGQRARVTWITAENDDGHLLALFERDGLIGAIGKSNFVTLRYREPVYRSLRELVMSYFDGYFNSKGQRTMRGYTAALDLSRLDRTGWMTSDAGMELVADGAIDRQRVNPVAPAAAIRRLGHVDPLALRAGLLGSTKAGLYRPT
jgi:hypothetical protein